MLIHCFTQLGRAGLVEQFLLNLTDLLNGASDLHNFFIIRKIILSPKNCLRKKTFLDMFEKILPKVYRAAQPTPAGLVEQ